jgi:hypothetical protein
MSFRTLMGWPKQGEGEKSSTPCIERVKCMTYKISLRPTTPPPTARVISNSHEMAKARRE